MIRAHVRIADNIELKRVFAFRQRELELHVKTFVNRYTFDDKQLT